MIDRDEAIKLAEEAGWNGPKDNVTFVAILQAYANLVAAYEREACAKYFEDSNYMMYRSEVATAIRARGQSEVS